MKQWKTRLAICLCLLLAAPTVISALPVNKLEAEAASGTSTNVYGYYMIASMSSPLKRMF